MKLRNITAFFLILLSMSSLAQAASNVEIDAKTREALTKFYQHSAAGKELINRAKGVLIFPEVYKAGIGIGGEYGEGKLMIGGKTDGYYTIFSASIGLQLGAQIKSQMILFMTDAALQKFRNSQGWEAGVDGSVALVTLGVGGTIDSSTIQDPIIGFIFSNKGLMYNLSLEGSKITRK
ncbi:YSC84-related protein [Pontibacter sp. JAM-7]|uniref:BPSL1445 family SYLF domain-containing lipoprotein n=1 Tax=Pontibacter sp. JAM-7 TaxID=3366581 RepID=UPI003AF85BBD